MEKTVKITLIISLAVLILVFGSLFFIKDILSPASSNTVTASGESKITVVPDLTSVYFFVETKDESASKAKDKNNIIFNKVFDSLVISGIDKNEIKTDQFSVNENWEWDGEKSVKKGFVAQHYAKLNLKNFDWVGKIIDIIIDNGARINSINFELSKEKENTYKAEALKLASKDAKAKAEAIASGLGKNLGKLVSVRSSDFNYQPWPIFTRESAGISDKAIVESAVAEITPSDKEITATVSVEYKLS
ncbi:SIMPL domain-containing protein [Candidatus Woesearchaeota archaeon]|nr:SIMPL domain-containing protein [Candidatus Woesearchaeota archaeon]